jgi:hypothetical protein
MASSGPAAKSKRRASDNSQRKLHEYKELTIKLLGFDTERRFDEWRNGPLVKPVWDIFVEKYLETQLYTDRAWNAKGVDVAILISWIRLGETGGKRRFSREKTFPSYGNDEDWTAWIVYWLARENEEDCNGVFFNQNKDDTEMYSTAYTYVKYAKRQRAPSRASKRHCTGNTAQLGRQEPELGSEASEEENEPLDAEKGTARVFWEEGAPNHIEESDICKRLPKLGGYSFDRFELEVDRIFSLSEHMQRRVSLDIKGGGSFVQAQLRAQKTGKPVTFSLSTEPAESA